MEVLEKEEALKNVREFVSLSEKIRHMFSVHLGQTIYLSRMVDTLMNNQRGSFVSKGKLSTSN